MMNAESSRSVTGVPLYGLKLKLNHKYPESWSPSIYLILKHAWKLLPLIIRLFITAVINNLFGNGYFISLHQERGKQIYGVPIGGIGAGSIGRGYRGEFCRYQLRPGIYEYNTIDANQFIITIKDSDGKTTFQSVLSTYEKSSKNLSSWKWLLDGSKCHYTGLYPRAWTEYDLSKYGIKLTCRQISPVIPHNYKDSSLPCAVFVWDINNLSDEEKHVTISFTFKNGTSNDYNKRLCNSKSFSYLESSGVVLFNMIDNMPCAYAMAAKVQDNVSISKCLHFDPNSNGETVWNQLENNGQFDKLKKKESNFICDDVACGIASKVLVKSSKTEVLEFCFTWDMPIVSFPKSNKSYKRFYTKYFGDSSAFFKIGYYAFKSYNLWEEQIYQWQKPVLDDRNLPDWYKGALFNETYYIADGGTIWFVVDETEDIKQESDPRLEYGHFAYLEGHEYRMYNTYDVHFYASFALAMNWPHLQLCVQYDTRDFISMELSEPQKTFYNGEVKMRKPKNCVPHDAGDSFSNPLVLVNSYPLHDCSEWKDLNLQFILQVLRDYCIMKDKNGSFDGQQYLRDTYKTCSILMLKSMNFDTDHDCLIENSGSPDQTFDVWVMTGSSAYCGGLWLAALYAMIVITKELKKTKDLRYYEILLEKAKKAFENKLWNGKYYNFDCSQNASVIMANQLCGHWYLRACGFKYEVFPKSKVVSALNIIFENNVMSYCDGMRGAVNGYKLNQGVDTSCLQSEEVWTGITYGLAACMIQEKMYAKAWKTAAGMNKTLVDTIGMSFQTPEAITDRNSYRAIGYMRPLSIWSMQLAWEQQKIQNNT